MSRLNPLPLTDEKSIRIVPENTRFSGGLFDKPEPADIARLSGAGIEASSTPQVSFAFLLFLLFFFFFSYAFFTFYFLLNLHLFLLKKLLI